MIEAIEIVNAVFRGKSHYMRHFHIQFIMAEIVHPQDGVVDEVLVSVFRNLTHIRGTMGSK